jgi:DNA-binding NarL/FixJ family response regulator
MTIRLLIADAHALVREALWLAFDGPEFTVIGEASTASEALRLALEETADVVLLDIRWQSGEWEPKDGFEVLHRIKSAKPRLPVLVYSTHDRQRYINRCRELGANGYLVKGVDKQVLLAAVRTVYAGEEVWGSR